MQIISTMKFIRTVYIVPLVRNFMFTVEIMLDFTNHGLIANRGIGPYQNVTAGNVAEIFKSKRRYKHS